MEDKELIEKFLKGDRACFDELIRRHKGLVFNLCLRMLGSYEEALDVSQDVFVKIYQSLKDFRFQASFKTYLYTVTLNFCRNKRKVLNRDKRQTAFSLDEPVRSGDDQLPRQLASSDDGPRDTADKHLRWDILNLAMEMISPEFREVLVLREMQDLSYEEIAQALELDMGTVKSRLNRARLALKEKLEGVL